jgi:uncharacterized protein (TIGR02284 family)
MTTATEQGPPILKHLLAACKDDENGYRAAVKHVQSAELQSVLQGYAEQRAQYAVALHGALTELGARTADVGTFGGALHLGWATIKAAATGNDQTLLAECLRAEEAARERYEKALTENLLPNVRELVAGQLQGIRAACDRLLSLQALAT